MLKREDIRIRDPFILPDRKQGIYYMYGTTALIDNSFHTQNTYSVYKTKDLENFEGPIVVFDGNTCDFWGDRDFWAPEVHLYNGKYYLFGSCCSETQLKATHIFVSDSPEGPFLPVSPEPATPREWACIDGTLWVENSTPYVVFCHEWSQIKNGEICAIPLADDLSKPIGEPVTLFAAHDNPFVTEHDYEGSGNYVTDGPFLFREDGKLKMIWSSFYNRRYLVLEAEADSLLGEWTHKGSRFDFDGGHAMIFETLAGQKMISLHRPNAIGKERATFLPFN